MMGNLFKTRKCVGGVDPGGTSVMNKAGSGFSNGLTLVLGFDVLMSLLGSGFLAREGQYRSWN